MNISGNHSGVRSGCFDKAQTTKNPEIREHNDHGTTVVVPSPLGFKDEKEYSRYQY
jgi:hypothetical protein